MKRTTSYCIWLMVLMILGAGGSVYAQGSIYSQFGLGSLRNGMTGPLSSMAGTGIALNSDLFINSRNPAGLSSLKYTWFEGSYGFSTISLSDGARFAGAGFNGFAFALPYYDSWGGVALFTLVPYSETNYSATTNFEKDSVAVTQELFGTGGITSLSVGSSFVPANGISIGINVQYLFGTIKQTTGLTFTDNSYTSSDNELTSSFLGYRFEIGAQHSDIGKLTGLDWLRGIRGGIVISTPASLRTEERIIYYTESLSTRIETDTVSLGKGTATLPLALGFGAAIPIASRLTLATDLLYEDWTTTTIRGNRPHESLGGGLQTSLTNSFRFSAGLEMSPSKEIGDFKDRIRYRAGAFIEKNYLSIGSTSLYEYGVTGGVGFPIGPEMRLDIGLAYGSKGTTNSGLLRESVFRLYLSISAPELWFTRFEEE